MRPARDMLLPAGVALLMAAAAPDLARADGYLPYYGFSGYYGGPAVYYTRDTDVHASTRPRYGEQGFGIRTYTTGGPFWRYKATGVARLPHRRERDVLRVRG